MVRIGTWNTEWAKPGSVKGERVGALLAEPDCDILCVTEGYAKLLPAAGHTIDAGSDWGYAAEEGRRKVLLWSKKPWSGPWSEIGPARSDWFPSGRIVGGTTQTKAGPLMVIGVCIPWADAHVRTGRKDRVRWEDHERWLVGFEYWCRRRTIERTIVLGDFNQRIPRPPKSWVPKWVYDLLRSTFEELTFATAGKLEGAPGSGLAIDHIAHSPDMALVSDIGNWPKRDDQSKPLSDHFGVWAELDLLQTGEGINGPSRVLRRSRS